MSKRLGLHLPDDTRAQIKQRADAAGVSMHSWIVAAIERENFRQLCQEANEWWAQHPEAAQRQVAGYHHAKTSGRACRRTVAPPPRRARCGQ